jgi:hypothetical protein
LPTNGQRPFKTIGSKAGTGKRALPLVQESDLIVFIRPINT